MIQIIQQYPLFAFVAAFVVGGLIGFFAACMGAVAHHADERIRREQ